MQVQEAYKTVREIITGGTFTFFYFSPNVTVNKRKWTQWVGNAWTRSTTKMLLGRFKGLAS